MSDRHSVCKKWVIKIKNSSDLEAKIFYDLE